MAPDPAARRVSQLWLADWSDSENDDFAAAWREAEIEVRVARSRALGATTGQPLHRLRSWPAYATLAVRALRSSDDVVVAWQPLVGALTGLVPTRKQRRLVVLNPLLGTTGRSARQRVALAGLRRAARIVFFTRAGNESAAQLGLSPARTAFVPLGVRARRREPAAPGDYLVAVGREQRDWHTLAAAARGLEREIRVLGPAAVPPPLRSVPQTDRESLLQLLAAARAVVVPLEATDRPAGQLAVLDAMAVGRPVVATENPGTVDYVSPETGVLVPPGDPGALRDALERVSDGATATRMSAAALAAAHGSFSLMRFVERIDEIVRELAE